MGRKSKPGSVAKGASLAAEVWLKLDRAVERHGGSKEDLERLNTDDGSPLIEEIAKTIARAGKEETDTTSFTVTVRGAELAALIKAGEYDWVNSDITEEHFPVTVDGESEVTVELIHFNRAMGTEAVEQELDKRGLRPALTEELLALGAEQPELQRKFPIVALGSSWLHPYGHRSVPYLYERAGGRDLGLDWIGNDWNGRCRFAAVRK